MIASNQVFLWLHFFPVAFKIAVFQTNIFSNISLQILWDYSPDGIPGITENMISEPGPPEAAFL